MAITVTTDMLYTRPGKGTESNVLSAHDPLIWEFQDSDAGVDSATVKFTVRDKDNNVIYSSADFLAYLYDDSGPILFRFDATQIIKHIIGNYFYRETSEIVEPENYGSQVKLDIITYDGATPIDAKIINYFLSHAVNQIGDEYGSNIPRVFYNDTEEVAHFLGFPDHLFFYSPTDLVAEDPVLEIYDGMEDENLITIWYNDSFDTFISVGADITSAIDDGLTPAFAETNVFADVVIGDCFVFTGFLTQNSGTRPSIKILDSEGAGAISSAVQLAAGANTIVLEITGATEDLEAICHIFLDPGAATNFEIANVLFVRRAKMSVQDGILGLYLHDWSLEYMLIDKTIVQAKALYDVDTRNVIKTYNITVFQPCKNAVYIRWLTKDGYYMYWAFSSYPYRSVSSDKLGSVINSFSEMALTQSRNFPIGYRDTFNKIDAIASAVPIIFRHKLMELFTSPAVYLWQGQEALNLISSWTNLGYETLETTGTVITLAINIADNGFARSAPYFEVNAGDVIVVVFLLTLNSGTVPKIRVADDDTEVVISNIVTLADGFNIVKLTVTSSTTAKIQIYSTVASNFSTSRIVAKRKEIELDWVLLDRVEGSHDLREKMKHDNFECTLILPENYTQQLSGQNI